MASFKNTLNGTSNAPDQNEEEFGSSLIRLTRTLLYQGYVACVYKDNELIASTIITGDTVLFNIHEIGLITVQVKATLSSENPIYEEDINIKFYSTYERKVNKNTVIYGFRKNKMEKRPYLRIEYLADAVYMEPAFMNYRTDEFDYGSWKMHSLCQSLVC